MTDLRTAAQQALDSINELFTAEQSEGGERSGHIRTPATREHLVRIAQARRALHESCDTLRAALAQQKDPTDPGNDVDVLREHVRHLGQRVRELRAQKPEPAPTWKPAEWKRGCAVCGIGADGKAYGYVCPRLNCPTKVTFGGAV